MGSIWQHSKETGIVGLQRNPVVSNLLGFGGRHVKAQLNTKTV